MRVDANWPSAVSGDRETEATAVNRDGREPWPLFREGSEFAGVDGVFDFLRVRHLLGGVADEQ